MNIIILRNTCAKVSKSNKRLLCAYVYVVFIKSREQKLITKEHLGTRTTLVLFKPIQYFSDKLFKNLF